MTTTTLKPRKITTTVRVDSELKNQAEIYARENHMDFSTLLQISLKQLMRHWVRMDPYYEVSYSYAEKLDKMVKNIDEWREDVYGPFKWNDAVKFLSDEIKSWK